MAARGKTASVRLTDILYSNLPYDMPVAYATVNSVYKRYGTDFLHAIRHLCDALPGESPVTTTELQYIHDNRSFIINDVSCFSNEVQPAEFLEYVSVPCEKINNPKTLILVFMQQFYLKNGNVCYYFLGTRFTDDVELQLQNTDNVSSITVNTRTLRSLDCLVRDLRCRTTRIETTALSDSQSGSTTPTHQHMFDDAARVTRLLLSKPPSAVDPACVFTSNGYIFCNDLSSKLSSGTAGETYREQVVCFAVRRLEYYRYHATTVTKSVALSLSSIFQATHSVDFFNEYLAVLSIIIMLHQEFDYIMEREMSLLLLRIENQLTTTEARTEFLKCNDLYEAFEKHQFVCQHKKSQCFERFSIEMYEETLRRMRKVAHYLMNGLHDEQLRESDRETITLLTWLVQQLGNRLRDIFSSDDM